MISCDFPTCSLKAEIAAEVGMIEEVQEKTKLEEIQDARQKVTYAIDWVYDTCVKAVLLYQENKLKIKIR